MKILTETTTQTIDTKTDNYNSDPHNSGHRKILSPTASLLIAQMREFLRTHNCDFSEISYSPSHTPERIRRIHKGTLCYVQVARSLDHTALVILPDGYRINLDRLKKSTGADWSLLDQPAHKRLRSPTESPPLVLVDSSLAHCDQFGFFDLASNTILNTNRRDFSRFMQIHFEAFGEKDGPEQYFAKMDGIAPKEAGPTLKQQKRCFIGISLGNTSFERDELLDATLDWIDHRFCECAVVIADSIHRLTRQVKCHGLDDKQALKEAIEIGNRFLEEKDHIFKEHSNCHFSYWRMSDEQHKVRWSHHIAKVRSFTAENNLYAREVAKFSSLFVRRQSTPTANAVPIEQQLSYAANYFIEEAGFCSYMTEQGWRVLVYPGPLDPFKAISDGEFPDAPESLRKLQIVSLKLKRIRIPGETDLVSAR